MPIADLQRQTTELGRIRLGQKKTGGNGRERPDRLDTYRFTSMARHLIEEIAGLYGGEVQPWTGGHGRQWEVVTETANIPIYLPQQIVDPFYESWGNGVCTRRCDGLRDSIYQNPCDCNPEKRSCKPTTHLSVMLADVPGIGVWRLTTHGIWAASELSYLSSLIEGIRIPLPGRLLLENRERKHWDREKRQVVTKNFNVPVVLIDAVTSRHVALGGDAVSQVVRAAAAQQVEAPPAAPALPAAPAPAPAPAGPPQPDQALIDRALAMIATATADQMADVRQRIAKTGDPQVLVQAFQARLGELEVERQQRAQQFEGAWDADEAADERRQASEAPPTASAAPPATTEPQAPAETPPALPSAPAATESTSGDRQAAMTRLLGAAGAKGLSRKQLDERMQSDHGVALKQATAAQLDALAAAL